MSDNIVKDNQRIVHMYEALKCLNEQASGLAFEEMAFQNMRTAAILHYLTILGEAANRMSKEFCEEHPDIPWREIAGLRHRLVHDYFEVEYEKVWYVLQNDLPSLREQITALYNALPEDPELPDNLAEFEDEES